MNASTMSNHSCTAFNVQQATPWDFLFSSVSHFSDKNLVYPGRTGKTKPEWLSPDIVDKLNLCLGVIKTCEQDRISCPCEQLPSGPLGLQRYRLFPISCPDKPSLCNQHVVPTINPQNYSILLFHSSPSTHERNLMPPIQQSAFDFPFYTLKVNI